MSFDGAYGDPYLRALEEMVRRRAERKRREPEGFLEREKATRYVEATKPKSRLPDLVYENGHYYPRGKHLQDVEDGRKWMEYMRQAQEEFQLVKKETVIDLDKN